MTEVQSRVLWLSARIIDYANHDRLNSDGVKVGGHQASSASVVTIMTYLWFHFLAAEDRVSVKPHASPVLHAIQYLLGNLDAKYLTTLREFDGLQSYPSRTKDPDQIDFSTGSVGLGAAAPLFASLTREYVDAHFGPRPASRFIALIGDAELDEGNIWEAIAEVSTQRLGNVTWIVDLNRQSLDRVIPGVRVSQWQGMFRSAGWHVVEAKFGSRLESIFSSDGGDQLRNWIGSMSNEHYQSLFGKSESRLKERFLEGATDGLVEFMRAYEDEDLTDLLQDLGGHDFEVISAALRECDDEQDRPSVLFAYTVKGWGLPTAGDPRNHSSLMSVEQIDGMRSDLGLSLEDEWNRFPIETDAGQLCARRAEQLTRPALSPRVELAVPPSSEGSFRRPISTQEAFGRVLTDLSRNPEISPYLVTTAPDVATSTNLAGFINRLGVFSPEDRRMWQPDGVLKWREGPTGQHIELGISEMNLFLLLGALGLSWDHSDQALIPVGTVYDPFVLRGLDAFIHGVYSGARFIVAGTPSGISLAPEGGAHQSTITASVGLELPNVTLVEPAFAKPLDWLLCDAIANIAATPTRAMTSGLDRGAYYFRLSTRPLSQEPFDRAVDSYGEAVIRRQVLTGAYRLAELATPERDPESPRRGRSEQFAVTIAACGPVVPEVLRAAEELSDEGVGVCVVDVTSADRLFAGWRREIRRGVRGASAIGDSGALRNVFPVGSPVVTVHDASSHALSWLGSALGVYCVPLGVDTFGQSGSVADLYAVHDLDAGSIVNAALGAIELSRRG